MHDVYKNHYLVEFIKNISVYIIIISLSIIAGIVISINDVTLKIIMSLVFIFLYISIGINSINQAFYIFIFLSLTVWISKIIIYENLSLLIGIGLILTILWIMNVVINNNKFEFKHEYWSIFGLFIAIGISTIINWGGQAGLGVVFTYVQLLLLIIIFTNLIKNPFQLIVLGKIIVLSSTIIALVILLDVIGILPPGVVQNYQTFVETEKGFELINRTSGIFDDPNFSAFQMIIAIPFLFELWPFQKRLIKGVLVIIFITIIMAINYTYSISGLIGLMTVIFLKLLDIKTEKFGNKIKIIFFIIIFLLITPFILPDLYIDRLVNTFHEFEEFINTKTVSSFIEIGSTRGNTWRASIKTLLTSPIFGIGPGNSPYVNTNYNMLDKSFEMLAPHNFILSIANDIGLLGLSFFLVLIVRSLNGVKKYKKFIIDPKLSNMGHAIFIALIACFIQGLGLDVHTSKHLWILIGMAISYKYIYSSVIRNINNNNNNLPLENV